MVSTVQCQLRVQRELHSQLYIKLWSKLEYLSAQRSVQGLHKLACMHVSVSLASTFYCTCFGLISIFSSSPRWYCRTDPPIDKDILDSMKVRGCVGYANNPRNRHRNQVSTACVHVRVGVGVGECNIQCVSFDENKYGSSTMDHCGMWNGAHVWMNDYVILCESVYRCLTRTMANVRMDRSTRITLQPISLPWNEVMLVLCFSWSIRSSSKD